jgi:chitodextrinase
LAFANLAVVTEDFANGAGAFQVVAGGTWAASGGAYVLTAPADGPVLGNLSVHETSLVGDFSLSADVTTTAAGTPFDDSAVVFGYRDPRTYYLVSLNEHNDSGTNGIFAVTNGTARELVDFPVLVPSGVPHAVSVSLTGSVVTATVDGTVRGTATLPAGPVFGKVGFGSKNNGGTFDNLTVEGTVLDDTQAPTTPAGLTAVSPYPTEVSLRWQPSTDDLAVAGYEVWRNDTRIASVSGTSYDDTDVTPSTRYTYNVRAYDHSGNASPGSAPAVVTTAAPDRQAPSRPTGLAAKSENNSQATLTWRAASDNYGVTGYRIYRNGTQVARTTSLVYTDSGLRPRTSYTYTVRADDRAGNVSAASGPAVTRTRAGTQAMPYAQALIDSAVAEPLTAFKLNEEWNRRSPTAMYFLTTAATYDPLYRSTSGVRITDRVLQHVRTIVAGGGDEPGCSGGLDTIPTNFAVQAFTIGKGIPEIWNRLSPAERAKVTLLVRACLVASHFVHDDQNPGDTGINQRGNTGKAWNANHVEGGIGMGLAAAYFLGAEQANAFLRSFDAEAFLAELRSTGFSSTHWVFSQTPAAELEAATRRDYVFNGHPLTDPFGWVDHRARITYGKTVAPTGADGKGSLVSGATDLPNVGQTGMEEEFESTDGGGKRSDLLYVSLGWNNSLANLWLVDHFGDLPDNAAADEVLRRYTVGTTDFFYKAAHGYRSWSLATDKGVYDEADLEAQMGYGWLKAVAPTVLPLR